MAMTRKQTDRIMVGGVPIGDHAPVTVQSMTNTDTRDIAATVAQIRRLEDAGCDIIRVAVVDMEAAAAIAGIKKQISIPVIADIHFDFRLAMAAASAGADGLRINPGNIGGEKKTKAVVDCARENGVSIRIGINGGSLEKDILKKYGAPTPQALADSAIRNIEMVRSMDFHNVKVSIKASDVWRTVAASRLLSEKTSLPLHLGVTEAGGLYPGIVKSSLGIGTLLSEGIGDTIRVSLTRDPTEEIRVGFEILKALNIRRRGPDIISCPTCGRCEIDLFGIVEEVERALLTETKPITVAIMGCAVNGPGEAKEADVGIAGGHGRGILFSRGKAIKKVPQKDMVKELLKEIKNH